VRARSKKLRNDELLVTAVKQLVEDFGRYLYLPRLADSAVLVNAVRDGLTLITWEQDSFAYADSFDEAAGRYRGLRGGQHVTLTSDDSGLLVKPEVARRQIDAEAAATKPPVAPVDGSQPASPGTPPTSGGAEPIQQQKPKRFHGTVVLNPERVGRDAGRIADEVIAHFVALVGSSVKVTLEVEAHIPDGASESLVRTVTENSRTLKFSTQGFETE
jgi:hypothetical protein